VVTGASRGIGAAIAEGLVAGGAEVLGVDLEEASGVPTMTADLAETASLDQLVAKVHDRLGSVDILVNCAGMFRPQLASDLTWESYDQTLRVNLHAPVLLMSRFAPGMVTRGYGRIVNVSSIHGRFSERTSTSYDVSKAGLEAATRTFALELSGAGVLVNAVAPGFVATEMSIVDGINELETEPFTIAYVSSGRLPLGRPAEPAEVAHIVLHLASSENTYITGQTLTVDGGLTAGF